MDDPEQRWKQLVKAAKPALEENEAPPPKEFGHRMARLRSSIRALALALTWKRWSILAAILAALVFVILFWLLREETPERPPIIQPEPPSHPAAP
jgi:hypothetical protein